MHAYPLIPGRLYHVHSAGFDIDVCAAHGCDAILEALNYMAVLPC